MKSCRTILLILGCLLSSSGTTALDALPRNPYPGIVEKEEEVREVEETQVTITVYHPVSGQCDGDPLVTADMSKIDLSSLQRGEIHWIAVSRDLLKKYPYGSRVRIESESFNGVYEVHDCMNKRHRRRIDVLIHPTSGVMGKWKGKIYEHKEE